MAFGPAPSNVLLLHFLDEAGKHSTSKYYIDSGETDPAAGNAAAISDAAQAISGSALYETEILIVAEDPTPASPTTGPYPRPADKGALRFNAADGSFVTLQIGAPQESPLANAWDYVATNSLVTALETALKTYGCTQEGTAITGFHSGHRRRPPRRKGQ